MREHNARLRIFAVFVLVFNIGVVLWGAYVRATGSGAGCGRHWPLCDGVVIPRSMRAETLVELTHRATSGLAMLLVLVFVVMAWRSFPRERRIRKATAFAAIFMLTEALIGASLVLKEWVAQDASVVRAGMSAVHLGNTYFLLAALTLSAWWIHQPQRGITSVGGKYRFALSIGMAAAVILGMTGAITALGDALFPSRSLAAGFYEDLNPASHFLIRLRFIHPFFAVIVSFYLLGLAAYFRANSSDSKVRGLAVILSGLILAQLLCGAINLALLAPISTQVLHLLLADLVWIALVLFAEANWFSASEQALHAAAVQGA